MNSYIKGISYYVPEKIITNNDLEKLMDTSDEWITSRTGIKQRHSVGDNPLGPSDLAVESTKKLFDKIDVKLEDIDFVIFATSSPDTYVPGSGSIFQHKMGLNNIGVLDIRQGCCGFVYAISVADQFIKAGTYKNILVVGSEVQTTQLDYDTEGRGTAIIFGDGATSALVQPTKSKGKGILSSHLHSDGKYISELGTMVPSPVVKGLINKKNIDNREHHIFMNGREVFRHAVKRFPEVIREGLSYNNLNIEDVGLVIPHQANYRITQAVQRSLKVEENKIFSNIHKYGNTTAASVGIALAEAIEQNRIKDNDIVVLVAFGAGFYWASSILKWHNE